MKKIFVHALRAATVASAVAILVMALGPVLAAEDSLYRDLGEKDGIATIAKYTTVNFLADPRIKATFDNTNMERFEKLLSDQFCVVAGGPCEYKGRSMAAAHKALGLDNADFNAVVEDLQTAMDKAGVPFATQNRLLARLAPMQHDIVTK
ncbi:MAG TPA: group 1 truncated hemoglobin [Rhizomicrobium sp.]|jgi:hemoglobin|nr:group 1 truncated hemoglobin [Rhizomicrobium sp.]